MMDEQYGTKTYWESVRQTLAQSWQEFENEQLVALEPSMILADDIDGMLLQLQQVTGQSIWLSHIIGEWLLTVTTLEARLNNLKAEYQEHIDVQRQTNSIRLIGKGTAYLERESVYRMNTLGLTRAYEHATTVVTYAKGLVTKLRQDERTWHTLREALALKVRMMELQLKLVKEN